ncbi:hypothetical protein [Microvirga sp. TS319]|uniref:hypothetical protein n=1 Tax=Microvirga sp. TS319 TaxID=3241165 RepID=UPI003519EBCB
MSLYDVVKGRAYELARIATGRSNDEAIGEGYKDVYDLLMSDSDHPRQQQFLMLLTNEMPEGHRKVLLDGLAEEYADVEGWMAYVDRECD